MSLSAADFATFFREVNGHEPFPWQERLLHTVADSGSWPTSLDLPTGSGKTAAIDVAVFHLALDAASGAARRAPVRIAFVVDRRLVVDDAYERARRIAAALASPPGPVSSAVAERLSALAQPDGPPLVATRLRGGVPRDDDWARTPAQPTVVCSTVDQVGSRLLFRGFGVSNSMKPVHAGLLGSDCLILLDEAHLSEPFRQTVEWVDLYRSSAWREERHAGPYGVARLSATPGMESDASFTLQQEDRQHPVLRRRLAAAKPARLILAARQTANAEGDGDTSDSARDVGQRAAALVAEVRRAIEHFGDPGNGATAPAIGVVVNRVARARACFELLVDELRDRIDDGAVADPVLMIGPARPIDRDDLVDRIADIRTRTWTEGETRSLGAIRIVVATQCLEAGVDIDLDGLVSELAPVDALRQRFGRLNRAGRDVRPFAAVVAAKADLSARYQDAVYAGSLKPTWEYLSARSNENGEFDFGVDAFDAAAEGTVPSEVLSERPDAPVLLPAHVDLLSHTSPVPAADPDIGLLLHGPQRQPAAITLVWRADVAPYDAQDTRRLLTLAPPRSSEGIELPLWLVRQWLVRERTGEDRLADVATMAPEEPHRRRADVPTRPAFVWRGDDDGSRWAAAAELRAGDTVVVPSSYGGLDAYGWNPAHEAAVRDVGIAAAKAFARRRWTVRVGPGLVGGEATEAMLREVLASAGNRGWRQLLETVLYLPLPDDVADALRQLRSTAGRGVAAYLDVYGTDEEGRPRGVVFLAPAGVGPAADTSDSGTEDDLSGSLTGTAVPLERHGADVAMLVERFAESAGLPAPRVCDLRLAGVLHDIGKSDSRFQAWLHYGDPLGGIDASVPLAKSGRRLPASARSRSGLPDSWRHEALSVRKAIADPALSAAADPELVIWLVGTHHGHGRPFYPHSDPAETTPDVGPQSLSFDWNGRDWAGLFSALKARYGVWELARLEAVLRLADHVASAATHREEGE